MRGISRLGIVILLAAAGCGGGRYRLPWSAPLDDPVPPRTGLYRPAALTSFSSEELMPAISPDGQSLIFVSDRSGNLDLWAKPVRGGVAEQLSEHPASDFDPVFSPDGRWLAFTSTREDAKGDIWVLDLEGRGIQRLTDETSADSSPSWFPDSGRLAFARRRSGETSFEVALIPRTGGEPKAIGPGLAPSVSPDGRHVVFVSFRSGAQLMPAGQKGKPAVFQGRPGAGGNGELWVHDLVRGTDRQLTRTLVAEAFPVFSPRGDRIVFTRFLDDTSGDGQIDTEDRGSLWSVPFDPEAETRPVATQLSSSRFSDLYPRIWGPWLLFTRRSGGQDDLYRCPLDGLVPSRGTPVVQWKVAVAVEDPYERQAALRALRRWPDSEQALLAEYEIGVLYAGLHANRPARATLVGLRARLPAGSKLRGLVEVELARLKVLELAGDRPPGRINALLHAALVNRASRLLSLPGRYPGIPSVGARARLEAARAFRRAGENAAAVSALQGLLRRYSEQREARAEARLLMADIFSETAPTAGVIEAYLKVIREFPDVGQTAAAAARRVLDRIEQDRADLIQRVAGIRNLIDTNSDLARFGVVAQRRIADLYHEAGDGARAADEYRRLVDRYPEQRRAVADARFALAEVSEAAGARDEAIDQLETILGFWRDEPETAERARRELARIALEKGRQETAQGELGMAIKTYRRLIDNDYDLVQAHRELLALLAARGRAAATVRQYQQAVKKRPSSFVARYALGLARTYLEPPDFDGAAEDLEAAIALNAQNPFAYQTLGWVFEQRELNLKEVGEGWLEKALEQYTRALSLIDPVADPKAVADLTANVAREYHQLRDWKRAVAFCRKRNSLDLPFTLEATEAQFHHNCGDAAVGEGELDMAVEELLAALALAEKLDNVGLQLNTRKRLALAYRLRSDLEPAVEQYRAVLRMVEEAGKTSELVIQLREIGRAYFEAGEEKQALEYFEKARLALEQHGALVKKESGFLTFVKQVGLSGEEGGAARGFTAEEERNFYLTYVGKIYRNLGDVQRAEQAYSARLKWLTERYEEDPKPGRLTPMSIVASNLAFFRFLSGDREAAAKSLGRSLDLARKASNPDGVISNAINLGHLVAAGGPIGRWSVTRAIELQREALKAVDARVKAGQPDEPVPRARLLANLGALRTRGRARRAPAAGAGKSELARAALVAIDARVGEMKQAVRDLDAAAAAARAAPGRGGRRLELMARASAAEVLYRLGRADEAGQRFERVLADARAGLFLDLEWRLLAAAALRQDSAELRGQALERLETRLPPLAGDLTGEGRLAADALYEAEARAALDRGDAVAALVALERREARRLAALVLRRPLQGRVGAGAPVAAERRAREAAADALARVEPEAGDDAVAQARAALEAHAAAARRLVEQAGTGFDLLLGVAPFDPAELIRLLSQETMLLRYARLGDDVVAFRVNASGVRAERLSSGYQELRGRIRALASPETSDEALGVLSWALLGRFKEELGEVERLYVAVDELGLDLPFAALRLEDRALGDRLELAHLTRAADLPAVWKRRNLNRSTALFLTADGGAAEVSELLPAGKRVFARRRVLGSGEATPERFRSSVRGTGVVHSRRGLVLDGVFPEASGLELASDAPGFGRMRLNRVAALPLSANLVAFERSERRGGASRQRSALLGLQGSLIAAGAPSMLVDLTEGDSGPGRGFYPTLYAALTTASKGAALAAAGRAVRDAGDAEAASARDRLDWARVRLYGYLGLDEQEARALAEERQARALKQAMGAFKVKQYEEAIAGFHEVLTYKRYLGDRKFLDKLYTGLTYAYERIGDLAGAIDYQSRLLELIQAAKNSRLELNARSRLGELLLESGQYTGAAEAFEANARLAAEAGLGEAQAVAQASAGDAHRQGGRYGQAVDAFRAALGQLTGSKGDELRFKLLIRLGTLYYVKLSRNYKAVQSYKEALALAERKGKPAMLFQATIGLGRTHRRMAEYDRARAEFDAAGELAEGINHDGMRADVALERGNLAWYLGEYGRALDLLATALKLAERINDSRRQIFIRNTVGVVLMSVGRLDRALGELNGALELAEKLDDKNEISSTLNNLGRVQSEKGDLEAAAGSFSRALTLDAQNKDLWGQANDHRNLGRVLQRLGRKDKALEHLERALEFSQKINDPFNEAQANLAIGEVRGQGAAAEQAFTRALDRARELGLKDIQWRALHALGRLAAAAGRKQPAREQFGEAITLVEGMRAAIRVEELQSGFVSGKEDLYDDMIHLLLELGREEEAFAFAERARSRSFIDLLGNRRIKARGSGDQELLERERKLTAAIRRAEAELRGAAGDEREALAARLVELQREYEELLVELKRSSPELASFVAVEPADLPEIQALIPEGAALVEFHVTDRDVVIFAVMRDRLAARVSPVSRERLAERIRDFRSRIQSFTPVEQEALGLFELLIRPVAAELGDVATLGILPHGALHYLPFAALHDGKEYLAERYSLFLAPSANALKFVSEAKARLAEPVAKAEEAPAAGGEDEIAGSAEASASADSDEAPGETELGPPGGEGPVVLAVGNPDLGGHGNDLPFAEKEVRAIRRYFPRTRSLIGGEATEASVRKTIEGSDRVHFACHGEFNAQSPMFSRLRLAEGGGHDGNLEVNEIFDLRLRADLVTLSACQTGLSAIKGGDELIGLNRAFLFAGTPSLVSSLWRVSDVATAVMIKRFYRYLSGGMTKARALREAQAVVRRYYPQPAYWAAFNLVGDPR